MEDKYEDVFAYGEALLKQDEEEAKRNMPKGTISQEEAEQMQMIRPSEEGYNDSQPSQELQEGQSNGDREYEKLSVGDSWKDAGKAVASEASKILLPNRDNVAGKWISDTFYGGHSEDDIWNYQAKTHFGEGARIMYEWGVPTLATLGAGTAVGLGLKATKVSKLQKAGSFFTKYLGFEDAITTSSTNALKKAGVWTANNFLTGSVAGGLVDVVKADHDRMANVLDVNEFEHPLQAALIRTMQDDGTDNQFTMRTKSLVEGFFTGGVTGVVLGSLFKIAGKTLDHFKTAKAGVNASTKEEAEALGKQYANEEIELQQVNSTLDKVNNVNEIYDKAVEQGVDGRDVIKAKFAQKDADEMIEMYNLREQGEQIYIHEDGTWDIAINNWEDAYKVSEDSYKAQLAARDVERVGDTAIAESNKATETTWRDRGWLASGENLVTRNDKGITKGNTGVAKRIVTNYKDKWKIDNNIKVEFIDGNGSESKTTKTDYLGKASKNSETAIKKAKTKIEAQQLKVDKAQDRVTMLEGGNEPVMEDLEVAQRELQIAQDQLKDLKAELSDIQKASKNQNRITNITIQIDKNSKNPYADLRAELEHARDYAKGETPADAGVEGSGNHFSRYKGDNEAEVAGGYTYGKSVARAKRNGLDTLNSDSDMVQYKVEGDSTNVSEANTTTTRTNESGLRQDDGRSSSSNGRGADSEVSEGKQLDKQRLGNSSNNRSYDAGVQSSNTGTTVEQLKLDFNTAEDLSTAVKTGDVPIKSVDDVDNIVNTLVEKDEGIANLSVKDMENDKFFQDEISKSDNPAIQKARVNDDKETLLSIFRKEMAMFKHIEKLMNDVFESTADTPQEQISELINQINKFGTYMKGIGSAAGTGLGQHAYFKNIFNQTLESQSAYESVKEGAITLADIIKNTLGETLNFTRGKKITANDFNNLFKELLENEQTAALMSDKDMVKFIRNMIQTASDKHQTLTVEAIRDALINKANEDVIRQLQSNLKLCKNPREAVNTVLNFNRELSAYYVHNLLSGVGSTGRNVASGLLNTLYYPMRKIFSGMDMMLDNDTRGELFREGINTYTNMLVSAKEALSLAIEAFKKGEGKFNSTMKDTLNAADNDFGWNWMNDLEDVSNFKVGDYTRNILAFMSRVMGASDEFLKQLNYRSIVRAKATEFVNQDMFKGVSEDVKAQYMQNFFDKQFTKDGLPSNMDALSEAQAITYQQNLDGTVFNPTTGKYEQAREATHLMKAGNYLHKISNQSIFMKIPFPFIKTGMNILNQNLEHNLIYNMLSATNRKLLTSPTKEGALLRSQCFVGLTCLGLGASMAGAGLITGSPPRDNVKRKALYRTGWRPYSVKIGNQWVSYTGIEPLHTWLGFAADTANLVSSVTNPEDEIKVGESILQGISMISANLLDKAAFRSGITQMNILFNPDTQDAGLVEKELAGLTRGFLPLSSFGRNVGTVVGEVTGKNQQKVPTTLSERIFDKYFVNGGLGEYRRNVFGEKQDTHTLFLIANMSKDDESYEMDELDRLARLGFNPKEISKVASQDSTYKFKNFKNVEGYSMYEEMMDRLSTLEIDGYTLRDAIRNRMTEDDYETLVDGSNNEPKAQQNGYKYTVKDPTKINALREVFSEYIAEAKRSVIEDEGEMFFDSKGRTLNEALEEANEAKMQNMIEASLTEHNADKIREY